MNKIFCSIINQLYSLNALDIAILTAARIVLLNVQSKDVKIVNFKSDISRSSVNLNKVL